MTDLQTAPTPAISATELAATLSARLCHDLINPASALVSGFDLMADPANEDLRDDALALIETSGRKIGAVLSFCRVAFGASASADVFDTRVLRDLTEGVFAYQKSDLNWQVGLPGLNKAAARALLNLAEIGGGCLLRTGTVEMGAEENGDGVLLSMKASGERLRLREEVARGLAGLAMEDGLAGRWVQAYYLSRIVAEAGGVIRYEVTDEAVTAQVQLPL